MGFNGCRYKYLPIDKQTWLYKYFSTEWSRTATQNNRNLSVTTAMTSAPHFTSRSSSVISDVTNSSGMSIMSDIFIQFIHTYIDCTCTIILLICHCVCPSQALCLQTAEYPTAPTATLSSTSSTDEICHCKARPDNCVECLFLMTVIIYSERDRD